MRRRGIAVFGAVSLLGGLALNGAAPGQAAGPHQLAQRVCGIAPTGFDPDTVTFYGPSSTLWPPNHQMVGGYSITAAEEESAQNMVTLTETITEVDSSPTVGAAGPNHEPDFTGSGQTAGASHDVTISSLSFRAERSGTGGGRTYRIDWTATFDNGPHMCSSDDGTHQPFFVTVAHDQGH